MGIWNWLSHLAKVILLSYWNSMVGELHFEKHCFRTDRPFTVLIDQLKQGIINSISAHAYVKQIVQLEYLLVSPKNLYSSR